MDEDYTKQSKLPEGAEWVDVEAYYYNNLLNEPVLKRTRQKAVLGKDPIFGENGKQRKRLLPYWFGHPKGKKPEHARGILYHLREVHDAVRVGKIIFITEGEAKADLLKRARLATGPWIMPQSCMGLLLSSCLIMMDRDEITLTSLDER
jgi:hypothetical protein